MNYLNDIYGSQLLYSLAFDRVDQGYISSL